MAGLLIVDERSSKKNERTVSKEDYPRSIVVELETVTPEGQSTVKVPCQRFISSAVGNPRPPATVMIVLRSIGA